MAEPFAVICAELITDLTRAGFAVTEQVDRTIPAPAVVVSCANPFITPGEMLISDEMVINLDIYVLFRLPEREVMVASSHRAVQDVLLAIDDRWTVHEASAPFRATNLGGLPVCRIRISANARITEGN